jgi:aminopeptidase N
MGRNDVTRLYDQFIPQHYILELIPDRDKQTFKGMVIISGKKIHRPNQRLTFHQNGLTITKATLTHHDKRGDQEIEVDRINHHSNFDEVRLHTKTKLYPGTYTIRMDFKGKITRQMNGMYPCFFEHDGKQKQLLATQFESHHAREVFPCIDEPEAKATFDLSITAPIGETVLANTPIKSEVTNGKFAKTTFETTPHMSTYLLAFVYGEMGFKEAKTKDGTIVRTYATPDNVQFTDFALEVAVNCLNYYNDYFDIPYPLDKCDLIALPDFASGAMENWGCITFREQCMLVDPNNTSLPNKQYVAMVVAHELAHQWFGNLVTMRWWTDLWLNEGFASWVEYLAIDKLFPEWEMWTQFAVDEQQRAFKLDALEHTHPIEVPVHHPDEIRTIFDTISYSKGASVIHMLHQYLGPDVFRDGLRHYLKRHAYGNTDTVDLWQALEEISGKPVKEFMHAWTSQSGFPLISAQIDDNSAELHQERFFVNPEHEKQPKVLWPVAILTEDYDLPDLLDSSTATFAVPDTHDLKLNVGQSGFYRTAYNSSHLQHLGEQIKKGHMAPLDRLGILSDMFEAAKAGRSDTADALHFLDVFEGEDNNAVWDIIASSIASVRSAMDDEDLREDMKPFVRKLTAKQLKRLGWEPKDNEPYFDKLLRPTIIGLNAAAEHPEVVKECLRRFKEMDSPEDLPPDLRATIYTTAVRHGDAKTFDKLFTLHEASSLSEERTTIAAALTAFKQPELVDRALSLIDSPSVRLQDVGYWIAYGFMNRFARDKTWDWMTSHWEWLGKNLGSDMSFNRFPMYAANAYSSREFLKDYKAFFLPKLSPAFERSVKQGIEVLQWQSAWKERDCKEVKAFFKHQSAS